jgi:Skp family chaperone for outer membrane proteins
MKFLSKRAAIAGLILAASASLGAAPAQAQFNGFAVNNPTLALAQSKSRDNAFQQINQANQAQIQLIGSLDAEVSTLQNSLDTNGDREISQAEVDANPNLIQQIQAKQQQIELASQPIMMAHYYVLEQLMADYNNARDAVIAEKGITVVLSPDAVLYAPQSMDITEAIAIKIDERQPTVATTVPAGWQPRQATVSAYDQVQQILLLAAQVRAARAAQQPGTAAGSPPAAESAPAAGPPAEGR